MEDWRRMPVSSVRHDLLGLLAEHFKGRRLPVARSIYLAVTELIAEAYGPRAEASRREVADRAGCNLNTLDEYVGEMEQLRLLVIERRRAGDLNLPNLWALAEPDMEHPPEAEGVGQQTTLPSSAGGSSAAVGHQSSSENLLGEEVGGGVEGVRGRRGTVVISEALVALDVPPEMRADAEAVLRSGKRIDGRKLTAEEVVKAAAALAEWNRQRGTESGLGANVTSLVMRIRERPSMTAEQHVKLVESAFRLKWWEKNGRGRRDRPLTPGVIWGSAKCFENVFQDAVAEARGEKSAATRGRFTRQAPVETQE